MDIDLSYEPEPVVLPYCTGFRGQTAGFAPVQRVLLLGNLTELSTFLRYQRQNIR